MPEPPPKRSRGRPPSNPNGPDRTAGGGAPSKSRGRKPKQKVEAEIEVKPDAGKEDIHNNFLIGYDESKSKNKP